MAFKLYPCLPSLPCSDISPNKVGRCLLRQPILLAQGFQIVWRVAKFRVFNHKAPLLPISSGAFPCFAGFFGNSGRVFDLLQCKAFRLGNQPTVKHAVGDL